MGGSSQTAATGLLSIPVQTGGGTFLTVWISRGLCVAGHSHQTPGITRTVQLSCWLHNTEFRPKNRRMSDPEVKDFHLKPSLAPAQSDIIQRGSWKSFQIRFFPWRSAKCVCQQIIKQHICYGHESGERGNREGRT